MSSEQLQALNTIVSVLGTGCKSALIGSVFETNLRSYLLQNCQMINVGATTSKNTVNNYTDAQDLSVKTCVHVLSLISVRVGTSQVVPEPCFECETEHISVRTLS